MIELKNIKRTFITKDRTTEALKGVSLTIEDGDIYGIIGMSGAGKSTLVRCINMLERPDEGEVIIDGKVINNLSLKELREMRKKVTMIFQGFNLLMQQTCLKNVMFPLEISGVDKEQAKQRALELLEIVGLKDMAASYPARLSGGQQQRVAIARALASEPKVLLCDEATSALDPNTTNQILDLIREINQRLKITVVIITHQMSVVENICNKVAILEHGEIKEEGYVADVFSHPKSSVAKKLVFPDYNVSDDVANVLNGYSLRVVFNGSSTAGKPVIANLAKEKGIASSIIYASIRNLNGSDYGFLILNFETKADLLVAKDYVNSFENVKGEEFDLDE